MAPSPRAFPRRIAEAPQIERPLHGVDAQPEDAPGQHRLQSRPSSVPAASRRCVGDIGAVETELFAPQSRQRTPEGHGAGRTQSTSEWSEEAEVASAGPLSHVDASDMVKSDTSDTSITCVIEVDRCVIQVDKTIRRMI